MKTTSISLTVIAACVCLMPSHAVPYLLVSILIVLIGGSPIAISMAIIIRFFTIRKARRKASEDFAEAYDAWKRAISTCQESDAAESWLMRCHTKLNQIKP